MNTNKSIQHQHLLNADKINAAKINTWKVLKEYSNKVKGFEHLWSKSAWEDRKRTTYQTKESLREQILKVEINEIKLKGIKKDNKNKISKD